MIEAVGLWVLRLAGERRWEALLLRRAIEPYLGEWFAVDGRIEPGESPRSAALRKLAEETSITPSLFLENGEAQARIDTARGTVWLHPFLAIVRTDASVALNAEHSDWRWSPVEEAVELVPLGSQRASLQRAIRRIEAGSADGILEATGASEIDHPGGNLRAHLERTAELLRQFGARRALQTAGLLHAAYGTDGFQRSLLRRADRSLLRALVGGEAEQIVHLYGACDRKYLYSSLSRGRAEYLDRFNGRQRILSRQEARDFVELTFANELDIARQDERFRDEHRAALTELFRRCRQWASEPAYRYFTDTFHTDHNRES